MQLNLLENIDITNLSSFRTKASTKYFFEINSEEDVKYLGDLGRFCEEKKINYNIIGKGTNTLFCFDYYDGLIIKNNLKGWTYNEYTKILEAYSNELISNISLELKNKYEQPIWNRFIGLPGGIGGAVFGNAGCFGLEAENNFLEADVYNIKTGKIEIFTKKDIKFGYRNSFLKENIGTYFIIKVRFDLSQVIEKYSSNIDPIEFRKTEHPKGLSCGSFFRNPSKENSAGALIDGVGLKGYKIGGAFFSEKHANFLMSDGTATYEDINSLMNLAISKIKKEKQIDLQPEVRIIIN